MGPLKIDDDAFWTDDFRAAEDEVSNEIIARGEGRGIVIDVPEQVAVDRRGTLPVAGVYVAKATDVQSLSLQRGGIVVAVDQRTHHVRVGKLLDRGKTPAKNPAEKVQALPFMSLSSAFKADLRAAVGLPWQPGRQRVAVLLREVTSNQVESELVREVTYEDPAVAAFLEKERKDQPPPWPDRVHPPEAPQPPADADPRPPRAIPDYAWTDASPPIPEEPGIALAGARVQMLEEGAQCVVRGSYRVIAVPREVVRPDPVTGERPVVGDPEATAVVPVTLVVTGSEVHGPWTIDVRVPSYDPVDLDDPAPVVTGAFAVDLFALGLPRRAQTFFVNAFSGVAMTGPVPMAFVSEEMLRRG